MSPHIKIHPKDPILKRLASRFGNATKLGTGNSLYQLGVDTARIYFRYSKSHGRNQSFFGLRTADLRLLDGKNSIICFIWEGQKEPLFLPYRDFEDVFASTVPATDGQIKVQVFDRPQSVELYIARSGRFNVERYIGNQILDKFGRESSAGQPPELSHSQVQTLLGAIGYAKGFDVWIPIADRGRLDWNSVKRFDFRNEIPSAMERVKEASQQIDVIWFKKGSSKPRAFYEVEHSTTIYSGLLRFNDVFLSLRDAESTFSVVADDLRRSQFLRQIARPTFVASGLSTICGFMEYGDVFGWYGRVK